LYPIAGLLSSSLGGECHSHECGGAEEKELHLYLLIENLILYRERYFEIYRAVYYDYTLLHQIFI
jgi:hypothetical protein